MTTIELTTAIADHFIKSRFKASFDHMPYNEFEITFPYGTFQSEQDMFQSVINKAGVPEFRIDRRKLIAIKKQIKHYLESNVTLSVTNTQGILQCKLVDKADTIILEFVYIGGIPMIKKCNLAERIAGYQMAMNLIYIITGVIHHMTSPKIIKHKTEIRQLDNSSTKFSRSLKKQTVRYLYKTKYTFENIDTGISDRKYNKYTDSWEVAGHWRTYKSGKTVWIEPYVKGTGAKENRTIKITKAE